MAEDFELRCYCTRHGFDKRGVISISDRPNFLLGYCKISAVAIQTTDAEIDAAIQRSALSLTTHATKVEYDAREDALKVWLDDGRHISVPCRMIQGLSDADTAAKSQVVVESLGTALHWPLLDIDYSVQGLFRGLYGNQKWMDRLYVVPENAR